MGRRGNRNKRSGKAGTKLARKKFRRSICSTCGLCPTDSGRRLCYNKLYAQDPKKFVDILLPVLIKKHDELKKLRTATTEPTTLELAAFKTLICDVRICNHCIGSSPKTVANCYKAFLKQLKPKNAIKATYKKKNKVPKELPVMTTIISDNDEFAQEIVRILEEYNNHKKSVRGMLEDRYKQQDQNSTAAYCTKRSID